MQEQQVRSKMSSVIETVTSDVAGIRTGRATPALVDGLEVAVYGGQQRLKLRELASITAPDPQMIIIDPWDKSIIGDIRKGIQEANIGLNPNIDGEIIRLTLPPMTTEDREKYVKLLSQKLETARVTIRQIRGDSMHDIKKAFEAKDITEDQKFVQEKQLQAITDEFIGKIETIGERKKQELLTV